MKDSSSKEQNQEKYVPIDCDFYDHFEIHAMRGTWLKIVFNSDSEDRSLITKITNLETRDKEEFATVLGGNEIRLDQVAQLAPLYSHDSVLSQLVDKLDYNRWADNEIFKLLNGQSLTEDLRLTVSHNYNALDIWINRINGTEGIKDVWLEHDQSQWPELFNQAYIELVKIINNYDVNVIISYKNLEGTPHQSSVLDILTHLVNHSTYHRGQVIKLCQENGLPTVSTDFINYSRLGHRSS